MRRFPLQWHRDDKGPRLHSIPWEVAEKAYDSYSSKYGTDQSLERLSERMGFSHSEMDKYYSGWRMHVAVLEVRAAVEEWAGKQGHDHCWYYPDIFNRIAQIVGAEARSGDLPPRLEFEAGCKRYQDEEYKKASGP